MQPRTLIVKPKYREVQQPVTKNYQNDARLRLNSNFAEQPY